MSLRLIESSPIVLERMEQPVSALHGGADTGERHHMVLVAISDRLFGHCLTCAERGDDVAVELFPGPFTTLEETTDCLACPVEIAWRVYRQDAARLFDNTVWRSLNGARREAENLASALASVKAS